MNPAFRWSTRLWSWGDDRRSVQVWLCSDSVYRVVELHRIGETSKYREGRSSSETCPKTAMTTARDWRDRPIEVAS